MNNLKYSQNFIKSKRLLTQLIDKANFNKNDLIIEIGAGKGVITSLLTGYSDNVIAVEPDKKLFTSLRERFQDRPNLKTYNLAFEDFRLPTEPFKTFSNIPFNHTAAILKKLFANNSKLQEAYLILQFEAAAKFAGKQISSKTPTTMLSAQYAPNFVFKQLHLFKQEDFTPVPRVKCILLKATRLESPQVNSKELELYNDFTAFIFNRSKPGVLAVRDLFTRDQAARFSRELNINQQTRPSELYEHEIIQLFNSLQKLSPEKLRRVKGELRRLRFNEERIDKVHRTRKDIEWRNKKNPL